MEDIYNRNMDETDSKIRLFFELTYQKEVQIINYIPLKDYSNSSWSPEKMYSHPHNQNYYVFINDPELINHIKEGELESQEYLYKLSDALEKQNNLVLEFNAMNIEDITKRPEEEQYIVFARINIDNFSFINDYTTASKAYLMEKNRPLIYANQGRIKQYLLGEMNNNDKNEDIINNLNSSKLSLKDEKKDPDETGAEKEGTKKKENLKEKVDYIPGHWFLLNMNNFYYRKKDCLEKHKKIKLVKFLSVIKYKEILNSEPDPQDPNNLNNNNLDNNNSMKPPQNKNQINNNINSLNIEVDKRYQQEAEFCFKANENSKLITVYQPKSCKLHFKKNDFYCKDCNKFCCLECFVNTTGPNLHKNHKIHLLDEVIGKSEEDSGALEERIKNLIKIIDNEIQLKRNELQKLRNENKTKVEKIKKLFEDKNSFIKQEEIKRAKTLAALVNEILRIMNDYNRRINYLKLLFEKGSMNQYLTNYYIFKKVFENETKKNLLVLARKVTDVYNYFMNKKANHI